MQLEKVFSRAMHKRKSLPKSSSSRLAFEIFLVSLLLTAPASAQTRGAELNPSILLFHKPHHTQGVTSIRRAVARGCRHVNVVVTLLCDIDENSRVQNYGVIHRGQYQPLNQQLLASFQRDLERVFAEAVKHKLQISVLAHLNSGGEIYAWRNEFLFDPLVEYAGYSYRSSLVTAVADALAATVPPAQKVGFALTGEMGSSVFTYPASYHQLLRELRQDKRLPNLKLGFSFNFNRADGDQQLSQTQQTQAQQLINDCDFIGMSNYRWFELPIEAEDFADSVQVFLTGMRESGAKVPATMPLHFSEIGIGGGTEEGLAKSPEEATLTPWNGSDNPKNNPWRTAAMKQFRRQYHRALLEFLSQPSARNPITDAFLWSEGSWDPLDITDQGFADHQIIEMILKHNRQVHPQEETVTK